MAELIDPNETSYMGSTEDSLDFSEVIDSSYTTNAITDTLNEETVTPYPLIEIEEATKDNENANVASTVVTEQKNELCTHDTDKNEDPKNMYSLLGRLINHLLIYKEIIIPLEFLASSSFLVPTRISASKNPSQSSGKPESLKNDRQNVLMNYLIQNYIQQNKIQSTIITGTIAQNTAETSKTTGVTTEPIYTTESISEILYNDPEAENNIVLIKDNLGNKQYITIEKYKALASQLNPEYVRLVHCIPNIRLPNTTDCVKYYTCEPQTATIREYSCPLNTAFNKHTRLCDTESYSGCSQSISEREDAERTQSANDKVETTKVQKEKICTELGKMKDPTSIHHYFICYAASETSKDIKSIRMTCPNHLIFCQSKKVCSTKRLCKVT